MNKKVELPEESSVSLIFILPRGTSKKDADRLANELRDEAVEILLINNVDILFKKSEWTLLE